MHMPRIDSAAMTAQSHAIAEVDVVLFGIMFWEFVLSLWFDFQIVARKRAFKWPICLYWATKYATLAFSVEVFSVNSLRLQSPLQQISVNCRAVSDLANIAAQISKAGASALFMFRAMALWARNLRVVIPLAVLHLGQWAVYLHNVVIARGYWEIMAEGAGGCEVFDVDYTWLEVQFVYAMVFDLIVLVVASFALAQVPGTSMGGHSRIWKLLFVDGMSYFVIAFAFYLACATLAWTHASVVIIYIVSDLATVLVSIAACRSFVRLYATHGYEAEGSAQGAIGVISTGSRFAWPGGYGEGSRTDPDVEMIVLPSRATLKITVQTE